MPQSPIITVLLEAGKCLNGFRDKDPNIDGIVKATLSNDCSSAGFSKLKGHIPTHRGILEAAISKIGDDQFSELKTALAAAKDHLHWRIDEGEYYAPTADVGDGYKTGNLHTLLVGPENAVVQSNDFLLGFFLLAPWTLYRDHKHLAPEVYVPLTGPSGWRFGLGEWQEHKAGSKIYNAPNIVHATRVYETPFLALFAWTRDIACICEVVNAQNWLETEQQLAQRRR